MSNGLLGQSDTCNEVDVVDDAEVGGAFHGDLDRLDVVILENADVSHKTLCFHGEGCTSKKRVLHTFNDGLMERHHQQV